MTGLVSLFLATQIALMWEFPRDYSPQPDLFVISLTNSSGHTIDQYSVPPSSVAACANLPETVPPDTYCAVLPACPPEGVVLFWVQAQSGETVSEKSNVMTCNIVAGHPCECLTPGEAVPEPAKTQQGLPTLTLSKQGPPPPIEIPMFPPVTPVQVVIPAPPAFAPPLPPVPG